MPRDPQQGAGQKYFQDREVFMTIQKSEAVSLPSMLSDLALASWETAARRMLLISQNRCSQDEYQRMFSEKAAAAMSSGLTLMSSFGQLSMTSFMAPWLNLAKANAERLREK